MKIGRIADWRSRLLIGVALGMTSGCVTPADFEKVRRDVVDLKRGGGAQAGGERVADLGARLDALEARLEQLEGRFEVSEHKSDEALVEAKAAREAASTAAPAPSPEPTAPAESGAPGAGVPAAGPAPSASGELQAYRNAYAAWRSGNASACIDRFREFLQTYPASGYADDAAYWMADCYFKQGDYKTAVLRFDDVVTQVSERREGGGCALSTGRGAAQAGTGLRQGGGQGVRTRAEGVSELGASTRGEEATRSARNRLSPDPTGARPHSGCRGRR